VIQGEYNAMAIMKLKKSKQAAWEYIQTEVPEKFRVQVISTMKTILKRGEK